MNEEITQLLAESLCCSIEALINNLHCEREELGNNDDDDDDDVIKLYRAKIIETKKTIIDSVLNELEAIKLRAYQYCTMHKDIEI